MNHDDSPKHRLPLAAEKLLRHRPPMLLIDMLLTRDDGRAKASVRIFADSIFRTGENTMLPEFFIEVIAQTMAAANGYDALVENADPKAGFIVGIDAFTLHNQVSAPADCTVEVATSMEFGAMKVMTGEVHLGSTLIATAEIKVWEQPDGDQPGNSLEKGSSVG